jgi:hypothetical protein
MINCERKSLEEGTSSPLLFLSPLSSLSSLFSLPLFLSGFDSSILFSRDKPPTLSFFFDALLFVYPRSHRSGAERMDPHPILPMFFVVE